MTQPEIEVKMLERARKINRHHACSLPGWCVTEDNDLGPNRCYSCVGIASELLAVRRETAEECAEIANLNDSQIAAQICRKYGLDAPEVKL